MSLVAGVGRAAMLVVLLLLLGMLLPPSGFRLVPSAALTEPWRLLTAHWVHLTAGHALLNLAAFTGFAFVLPDLGRTRPVLLLILAASFSVDLGVLLLHADLAWYVGFSGVLYGMAAGAAVLSTARRRPAGPVILVGLAVKLAFDELYGTPAGTIAIVGGKVLSEAHLYGVSGGVLAGLFLWAGGEASSTAKSTEEGAA